MKLQKTKHFQATMKNNVFWRFLYENETKRNPPHAAETDIQIIIGFVLNFELPHMQLEKLAEIS